MRMRSRPFMRMLAFAFVLGGNSLLVMACDDDSDVEDAAEEIGDAAEDAADEVEDALD
jgi:hypothetical protein